MPGRSDWHQLIRFCVVGASGYLVNLAVFSFLVHGVDAHHVVAAIGAFCVAWTNNFVLNKFWTFQQARPVGRCSRARGTWR